MADQRPSLFTLVSAAYGTDYIPILVPLSPGTFANARISVAAFQTAVVPPTDLALQAYNLAVTGTNAAATAQTTANNAQATANAGVLAASNAQSTANTALNTATPAFSIAVVGTNAAAAAQSTASSAQSTANSAFSISVIGTNAAATAQSVADSAYALAQIGTNTGSAAYALALNASGSTAGQTALDAFNIAVAGTNAAATAQSTANSAYALAQIGTNTGTAAYDLAAAALPTTGGTLTGNLYLPNTVVGVGTVPVSEAVSGTLYYDFAGSAYQETTASSAFMVSAKNYRPGVSVTAIIVSDGTQQAVTYDSTLSWFGTQVPSTSATSGKKITMSFTSLTNEASGVLAGVVPQL